ncbi:MAG: Hpt domain-containing protein, partial [Azovibrio sp.]|nr:Hpt domain-containing protein [Azovibrio sp.]
MNAATDFDLGPLTWVKGEIDLALERATEALQNYQEQGDLTQLKFCRTHLHQVHGALSVVGLDGVTQLSEALEALLLALENGEIANPAAAPEAAREAFAALRQYLDDLIAGEPNQPLRLLPVYQAVAAACGQKPASPTDLFFPDLSLRPPKRPAGVPLTHEERTRLIRSERSRFQKGLLNWLRHPEGSPESQDGLALMQEALRRIEATQISPSARAFWWAALGLITALAHGAARAGDARALCARIDLQIRRLLEGNPGVAERLQRDCLYFIAHSPASADPLLAEIQSTYRLASLIPSRDTRRPASNAPQEATLRRLRETIATAEEQWNRFCAGSATALSAFVEQTRHSAQLATQLEHPDLNRLAQTLTAAANWLAQQPSRQSDSVAMEIATALLLIQTALEHYNHLGQDFPEQVDLMVKRLHTCMAGETPADADVPLLDEMSRRAQERLLMAQVAREIQSNLAQIEQTLDVYFRDPSKRPEAAALEGPLRQIAGALTILGQDAAVRYLHDCEREILRFAQHDVEAAPGIFEQVAQQLSILGFFVDALQHGNTDFQTFLDKLQGKPAAAQTEVDADAALEPVAEADLSVESQLNRLKRETHALLEALKAKPDDPALRDDLQAHLEALQKDADLVADQALLAQAKAALAALTTSPGEEAPQMQAVEAALAPLNAQPETPAPSAETLQLAQASTDELDAELLDIFLEEAREVLATIDSNLAILRRQPHDVDTLTTIRRSSHTLKGSGRMVGLKDLGETAWAVEQTLNLWLRQELEVTPELLDMIGLAHQVFSVWVEHLASGDGLMPDPKPLIALAERLRGADSAAPAAPATSGGGAVAASPVETPEPAEAADAMPDELLASRFDLGPLDGLGADSAATEACIAAPAAAALAADLDFSIDLDADGASAQAPDAASPAAASSAAAPVPAAPPTPDTPASQSLAISPQLYEIFRDEARGHMDTLHRFLAELAQTPNMPTPFEIGRAAHTLAGIAGTVGITPINKLGQALEHALLRRDAAQHPDSVEGLEVLRQTMDMLESMFARMAQGQMPEAQPALIDALAQIYPATESGDKNLETVLGEALDNIAPPPEAETATAEAAPPAPAPDSPAPAEQAPILHDEMDEQLLPIFLEEAQELVAGFQTQIAAWRAAPGDSAAPNALARLLHTFKGSSRMAGAMSLGQLTHAIESRVSELAHAAEVSPADLDEIETACDLLAQTVERYQAGDFSLPSLPDSAAAPATPAAAAPDAAAPAPTEAPASPATASVQVVGAVGSPAAEPPEPEIGQKAVLRVRADLVDQLVNEAGELSIARARIEGEMRELKESLLDLTGNVIRLRHQLREIEIQAESQIQAHTRHEAKADFDPLELDRFTRFQELTRMMAESVNDVATVQQNLLKNLDDANAALIAQARLNRSLQQSLMSVRMVPFASQSERLYRLVRQTAKELGKRANLELQGGQVELDRSVLEKILPPLEHMLRNAVAHGLEPREQRLAAGKEEIGEISLSLSQEGNEIILS